MNIVTAIAQHLESDSDVIRCAAARALGRHGDETVAALLVETLRDEDPDVRADAMSALVHCARPRDADAILQSLIGDPVQEVKIGAIETLARLNASAVVPTLRALARDRCEGEIAWEDEADAWDDWLDVQVAAIEALGTMVISDAVPDLLDAREDEFGQDLDHVVFAAFAKIPNAGLDALLSFVRRGDTPERKRALDALAGAQPDFLKGLCDALIDDPDADVRRLAISSLDLGGVQSARLALDDPDVTVRRAAVAAFASDCPKIAQAALADSDETVRALALEAHAKHDETASDDDLFANVQVWMNAAGAELATICATILPLLSGAEAEEPLCRLVANDERPLEARLAALQSLASIATGSAAEALGLALGDQSRQIRTAALVALAKRVGSEHATWSSLPRSLLVCAIRGELQPGTPSPDDHETLDGQGGAASKVESDGSRWVRISRDGEIIEDESPNGQAASDDKSLSEGIDRFPQSTLDAIQRRPTDATTASQIAGDQAAVATSGSEPSGGRRRRVAVEGPTDTASDLRLMACRIAANCPGDEIERAILATSCETTGDIRLVALEALALRASTQTLSGDTIEAVTKNLADNDPRARAAAARTIIDATKDGAHKLANLIADSDASVRSLAVEAVGGSQSEAVVRYLRDSSQLVRQAVLRCLTTNSCRSALTQGLAICLESGQSDSLAEVVRLSEAARRLVIAKLSETTLSKKKTLVLLEALASLSTNELWQA